MKGVVLEAPRRIQVVDDLPEPAIDDPFDAVVRVVLAGICGTDLHAYRGHIPDFRPNVVLGHEAVGIVEAAGRALTHVSAGDRVCISDLIACGRCWYCVRGLHYQCPNVSLFGFGDVVGPYFPGAQADFIRIPRADLLLLPVPHNVPDDQAVFASDVLPTAHSCVTRGGVSSGDTVAIIGCGPIGLCCGILAFAAGASRAYGIDPSPLRRGIAESLGIIPIDPTSDNPASWLRGETAGRGVDVALECVGNEASLQTAIAAVRGGGTVSVVGSHHTTAMPFSPKDAFGRELRIVFSVGDPIRDGATVLQLLASETVDVRPLISNQVSLNHAADAYRVFDRREAVKLLLVP